MRRHGSRNAGTPLDETATFFDSAQARDALAQIQADAAALPKVLATSDPAGALAAGPEATAASGAVSPDGRVALIRVQYPVVEELSATDLENLTSQESIPHRRLTATMS